MPTFLLGRKAKAYFNEDSVEPVDVAGSLDWQSWLVLLTTLEADNLTDVALNMASEFADTTTRGSAADGFSSSVPVLKNGEITFDMIWKPELQAAPAKKSFTRQLTDAWQSDTVVSIAFMDQTVKVAEVPSGDTISPQGLVAKWSVSLDKSEDLRDVQKMSATLTIATGGEWFNADDITGT